MTDTLWLDFAALTGAWTLAVMLPGPNFLATAHAAAARSRADGLRTALGIAVGTALWATGSLLGLGLLFRTAAWVYEAVRLIGGAYLVWTGLRLIFANGRPGASQPDPAPASRRSAFRHGLLVDLANPKAAMFFASLFAVAVPPDAAPWFKALAVGTVVAIGWGWYSFVACAVASPPVAALLVRWRRAVAVASGALFVGLGRGAAAGATVPGP
ncbi:LysE family translocator [Desulfocurvus vexinensis]|uniref:LysE family translocator n=1 Tax=Desulfocurvus vexinensis TaxID=399548 RepID=UPI0004B1D870|nr:LysE family translocator [Desulfocurvus vexinensis]